MIHTHDKNLTILNDFHTQAKKKKTKEKYQTKQQNKFMIHTHDKNLTSKKKKTKEKYQIKQQKKFMIHTHDKNLTILNDFHTQAKQKKKKKN